MSEPPPYPGEKDEGTYPQVNQPAQYPQTAQPGQYPPAGQQYPPAGQQYPPAGQQYPPAGQQYPPTGPQYPPAGQQYAPPAGQQYPPQAQQQTTVIVTRNAPVKFGEFPAQTTCPHCQASVTTSTEYNTGLLTWIIVGGFFICGCWLGCCCIPFCINSCKDVTHTCPNCTQVIGHYKRIPI